MEGCKTSVHSERWTFVTVGNWAYRTNLGLFLDIPLGNIQGMK